ncbi:MAG: ribonuclease III [Clostridiales bacterium]|jgi:ribonuclease-3|nr:ribonuclease III [Clostridiales bacterium]
MCKEISGEFKSRIGYEFNDGALLAQALTHSSYSNERKLPIKSCNERLEYLGDAVLELSVSDHVFSAYPDLSEGEMTKLRASVVCEPTLAGAARRVGLGAALRMGRGEDNTGGRERDSILSDAFEAVIGAIYKDGGFGAARDFVKRQLTPDIETMLYRFNVADPKTFLQERIQARSKSPLVYTVIGESGPDHDKTFRVAVSHCGSEIGRGEGRSKKEAEQAAANDALKKEGVGD